MLVRRRQKACCVRADGSAFADPLFVEKRIRLASPPGDSVRIQRKHVLTMVIVCSICVHLQYCRSQNFRKFRQAISKNTRTFCPRKFVTIFSATSVGICIYMYIFQSCLSRCLLIANDFYLINILVSATAPCSYIHETSK